MDGYMPFGFKAFFHDEAVSSRYRMRCAVSQVLDMSFAFQDMAELCDACVAGIETHCGTLPQAKSCTGFEVIAV